MFEKIIKVPYTTNPHMEKYDGPIIVETPLQSILEERQIEYMSLGPTIFFESDIAIEKKLVKKTVEGLNLSADYNTIVSLGLNIQEDIIILHEGKIEAAFVAFPSNWSLENKQGKTLEEIHEPVADGEILRQMSNKLTQLLCGKYNYHRYVWTLSPVGMLSMHTMYNYNDPDVLGDVETLDDLWFRLEHQTTLSVVEGETSAFFINVDVLPFESLFLNDKYLILDSINSMSENILKYKNLYTIKKILNNKIIIP
jgi:hypothetical protein